MTPVFGGVYIRCEACDLLTFDPRTGRCTDDDCWGSEEPEWQAAALPMRSRRTTDEL